MGGTFSKANRPVLPGPYFNWEAVPGQVLVPNLGSTVALCFTSDWGPVRTLTQCDSFAAYEAAFGTNTTPGRIAAHGCFKGEGVTGRGGAGTVFAYRMAGSSAQKASRTIQNIAGSPANAITLTALYEGTRGNQLKVAVVENASSTANNDLILYDGTVEIERYAHTDTDIAGLVASINLSSDWVTATLLADGTALYSGGSPGNATPASFTSGNDGATITSGDYTTAMSTLETARFSLLAFANITPNGDSTDNAILASLVTWATNLNNAGKRFMTVIGGASSEILSAAITRSTACNSENFVNVGEGTYTDEAFGDLSTSQLAPRVAGILAQRGEVDSLTYARLEGLKIKFGPTESEKLQGFKNGVLLIGRDSNAISPTRLEREVTTFTTKTDTQRPYLIYRTPKFIRTMHGIQMEFTEWVEGAIIGQVPVNNKTRDIVKGEVMARLQARVRTAVIQPNPTVEIDQNPLPSDFDDFIAYVIGIAFGRSVQQVFFTLKNQ